MRPLEDGCRPHCEVQFALIAAVVAALASGDALTAGACWARCTFGPEARFKIESCGLLVGEHLEELQRADCALAHELIVDNSLKGVKYELHKKLLYFSTLRRLPRNSVVFSLNRHRIHEGRFRENHYEHFGTIESGNTFCTCGTGERGIQAVGINGQVHLAHRSRNWRPFRARALKQKTQRGLSVGFLILKSCVFASSLRVWLACFHLQCFSSRDTTAKKIS